MHRIRTRLAANRYEQGAIDLVPDAYKQDGAKGVVGSFRDNFLTNFGTTSLPYDADTTRERAAFMLEDSNIQDPTFSWRDWDGAGQIRAQTLKAGQGGDGEVMYGNAPNPSRHANRLSRITNLGVFDTSYKKDQTMVKPYSPEETGLSMSVDIDHTQSADQRQHQSVMASMRRNNAMQVQRKKPDNAQTISDDNSIGGLGRPYSYNGDMNSNAGLQMQRHTTGGIGQLEADQPQGADGTGRTAPDKLGWYEEFRQRSQQVLKRMRLGVDGYIAYERNMHAPKVIDTGLRPGHETNHPVEAETLRAVHVEQTRAARVVGGARTMADSHVAYDGRFVDAKLGKVAANMTLNTPQMGSYMYDGNRLWEMQTSKKAVASLMDRIERAPEMLNDIDVVTEELARSTRIANLAEGGSARGWVLGTIDAHDEQQIGALAVAALSDPYSRSSDIVGTDMDNYYESLSRLMPAAHIPDFLTMIGRTIETMQREEGRQTTGGRIAGLKEAGNALGPQGGLNDMPEYEGYQTVNGPAKVFRTPGRAVASPGDFDSDQAKYSELLDWSHRATIPREHVWQDLHTEQPTHNVKETVGRAAHYGGAPSNMRDDQTDMRARAGKLGSVIRRGGA